jgi:hypothetical protein
MAPHFQKQMSQYVGIVWTPARAFFAATFADRSSAAPAVAVAMVAPLIFKNRLRESEFMLASMNP